MPILTNTRRIAFSVTNCICYDQRVLKMAETVSKLNCEITIIGRRRGDCCNSEMVPFRTKRFRMIFKKGFLFYKFFNIRLFFYLLFHKFDLLVANDLDTLFPNFLISKLKSIPLVYDSHEYFTEVPELLNRPFVRSVWMSIESMIFPHLKNVVTVSEPIALKYEKMYNKKPLVVRNMSKNADDIVPYSRQELNVSEQDLLVIIQGTGINIDKGAEELIVAVNISSGVSLLIVGSGDVLPQLKLMVKELKLDRKVKFFPKVTWEVLMKFTKAADAGMCIEKDTNLSYRFSLPNKLFDYIAAGIPVIANDLPESGRIIRENSCGVTLNSVTPENILRAFNDLKNNPGKLLHLKRNSAEASRQLNWETESKKVAELYDQILNS